MNEFQMEAIADEIHDMVKADVQRFYGIEYNVGTYRIEAIIAKFVGIPDDAGPLRRSRLANAIRGTSASEVLPTIS